MLEYSVRDEHSYAAGGEETGDDPRWVEEWRMAVVSKCATMVLGRVQSATIASVFVRRHFISIF